MTKSRDAFLWLSFSTNREMKHFMFYKHVCLHVCVTADITLTNAYTSQLWGLKLIGHHIFQSESPRSLVQFLIL